MAWTERPISERDSTAGPVQPGLNVCVEPHRSLTWGLRQWRRSCPPHPGSSSGQSVVGTRSSRELVQLAQTCAEHCCREQHKPPAMVVVDGLSIWMNRMCAIDSEHHQDEQLPSKQKNTTPLLLVCSQPLLHIIPITRQPCRIGS